MQREYLFFWNVAYQSLFLPPDDVDDPLLPPPLDGADDDGVDCCGGLYDSRLLSRGRSTGFASLLGTDGFGEGVYVGFLVSRGRSTGLDSSFGVDGFGDGVYVGLLVSRGRSTGIASSLLCFSGAFGERATLG